MDYNEEEYLELLKYIKSTWEQMLDTDWRNTPKIEKVIIDFANNKFKVCVRLLPNKYYKFDGKDLIEIEYDGKSYIKTEYYVNNNILLYMIGKGNIIKDLGLKQSQVLMNPSIYVENLETEKYLSDRLQRCEEDYAEDLYCREHDL